MLVNPGQAPGFSPLLISKRCTFLHCIIPYMKSERQGEI